MNFRVSPWQPLGEGERICWPTTRYPLGVRGGEVAGPSPSRDVLVTFPWPPTPRGALLFRDSIYIGGLWSSTT